MNIYKMIVSDAVLEYSGSKISLDDLESIILKNLDLINHQNYHNHMSTPLCCALRSATELNIIQLINLLMKYNADSNLITEYTIDIFINRFSTVKIMDNIKIYKKVFKECGSFFSYAKFSKKYDLIQHILKLNIITERSELHYVAYYLIYNCDSHMIVKNYIDNYVDFKFALASDLIGSSFSSKCSSSVDILIYSLSKMPKIDKLDDFINKYIMCTNAYSEFFLSKFKIFYDHLQKNHQEISDDTIINMLKFMFKNNEDNDNFLSMVEMGVSPKNILSDNKIINMMIYQNKKINKLTKKNYILEQTLICHPDNEYAAELKIDFESMC